jgi:hypothetical protein
VKLARLRRPKATCSPSYADYKPKTNVEILWDMGTKGRLGKGGIGQGKETKARMRLMCSLYRMNIEISS